MSHCTTICRVWHGRWTPTDYVSHALNCPRHQVSGCFWWSEPIDGPSSTFTVDWECNYSSVKIKTLAERETSLPVFQVILFLLRGCCESEVKFAVGLIGSCMGMHALHISLAINSHLCQCSDPVSLDIWRLVYWQRFVSIVCGRTKRSKENRCCTQNCYCP